MTILVSACLWGESCRYDGKHKICPDLIWRLKSHTVLPVCPEQLGGLPTPRPACRLKGGDGVDVLSGRAQVVDENDCNRTDAFIHGARCVLEIARKNGVTRCYLKAKSPSCGSGEIAVRLAASARPPGYRRVVGVTAAILIANGFDVEEIP